MKQRVVFVLAVLLTTVALLEAATVVARINSKCLPEPGLFTVQTQANGFARGQLAEGTGCGVGNIIPCRGFSIQKSDARGNWNTVYSYQDCKKGPSGITEKPVPLSQLVLGPGSYRVIVDGGISAVASITYTGS